MAEYLAESDRIEIASFISKEINVDSHIPILQHPILQYPRSLSGFVTLKDFWEYHPPQYRRKPPQSDFFKNQRAFWHIPLLRRNLRF